MGTQPFFSWTAQGITTISAIVGVGLLIVKQLRKLDRNWVQWLWEHDVMWTHHKRSHQIPAFPNLNVKSKAKRSFSNANLNDGED